MLEPYEIDQIYILKWEDIDKWGEPETRKKLGLKVKINWKRRWVRNVHGEEVVSSATILMSPRKVQSLLDRLLTPDDRILIEDEKYDHQILEIGKPTVFGVPQIHEVTIA
jgi:predicted NAD-dependent protein-ADP-ribosyltransferase YbiA (DUF1768 family)